MTAARAPRTSERGFAALVAIGVIALLSIAVMSMFGALSAERSTLRSLRIQTQLDRASATAEARVLFILLTQPMGPRGPIIRGDRQAIAAGAYPDRVLAGADGRNMPAELALDDRPYALKLTSVQTVIVRAQDSAGLLNLNAQSPTPIARLATLSGFSRNDALKLAGALADYIDEDDQPRFDGAEERDYLAARMPAPANAPLADARHIYAVLGWGGNTSAKSLLGFAAAAQQDQSFNVNTASERTLRAALGVDARMAALIRAQGERSPFFSVDDLISRTGAPLDPADGPVGAKVGKEIKLSVGLGEGNEKALQEERLILSLDSKDRPFMLGAFTPALRDGKEADDEPAKAFPWIQY